MPTITEYIDLASKYGEKMQGETAAQRTRRIYTEIKGSGPWVIWRQREQTASEFAMGDQLSSRQLQDLQKAGMPTFIVNKTTPGVESLKYFATASNPKPVSIGVEGSDTNIADIWNGLFEHCWSESHGRQQINVGVGNALTRSLGYLMTYVDKNADDGMGEALFMSVDPFDVYADPYSTDPLFRDATFIIVKKDLKRQFLMNEMPELESVIASAVTNDEHSESWSQKSLGDGVNIGRSMITQLSSSSASPNPNDFVDYYEMYEKVRMLFWNLEVKVVRDEDAAKASAQVVDGKLRPMVDQIHLQTQDQLIALTDDFKAGKMSQERYQFEAAKVQRSAESSMLEARDRLIQEAAALVATTQTRVVSDADYQLLKGSEITASTIQSAVPFYKNQVKLTVSIGENTQLLSTILPIDDYPIVPIPYIHTGTPYCISIVSIIKGRQEELTKAHQIMIYNASLGSSLRWMYRQGTIDEKEWSERVTLPGGLLPVRSGEFPVQVPPANLTGAFMEISMMGSRDIDDLFGIMPVSQGKVESGGEQPYRGLLALDEFSTRRSKAWVTSSLDPALNQLAHVWQQYAAIVYTTKKVYRITGPNNQSTKYEINVPLYGDDSEYIGKWNDLSTMKYDVRFESGGTMPVNRFAKQEEYFKYFQAGVIDDIALIAETDISHKEQLIQRKSLYVQLQNTIQQQADRIKQLSGDVETLSREVVQSGIKNKTLQSTSEIAKATAEYKASLTAEGAKAHASTVTTTEALRLNADHMTRTHQAESDLALREQDLTTRENALAEKEKATGKEK